MVAVPSSILAGGNSAQGMTAVVETGQLLTGHLTAIRAEELEVCRLLPHASGAAPS